ncbi:hypothetical protein BDA99DRAFT_504345 [Phascolomyces articulosus]|uniref:Phosphoglucomutase n=1 Tax=Phascolomyces articulosus TaxID=60185 RepID=A0AAD5K3B7_9FUNG|nr:hypothetical protein BDA99DRAFT_504345 [Phascolomyces articulosus]
MSGKNDIATLVQEWLSLDQNDETRTEITSLLEAGSYDELKKRLGTRIEFGTAGLRAKMEAGFSRMNDLTVLQTSQGLAKYLVETVHDAKQRGVVIGHDHRHHSESFARLTASTFIILGFRVWYYHDYIHTPLVPFTVKQKNAAAGVMITASHNPKQDNGYKVYWENACQIIPPHDKGIAATILDNLTPWSWDYNLIDNSDLCTEPEGVIDTYFEKLAGLSHFRSDNAKSTLKFAYTAMHGVGAPFAKRAFEVFDLPPFIAVDEQIDPDPNFSTVEFPNPEEGKGSLRLAIQTADRSGAQLILANDPDADRLAIAERVNGEWKLFTGNQIGAVLGAACFEKAKARGIPINKIAMVASTVSSKFLARMAEVEGFRFEEALTGFKWIGNKSMDLENEGYYLAFAYEEAIGFTIGDLVKDKDGISALAFFAEWAVQLQKRELTINQYLETLYAKYGYFVSENSYFICDDKEVIKKIFERIRYGRDETQENLKSGKYAYPKHIAGIHVVGVRDLTVGYDSTTPDNKPTLPVSASSEMITFRLENNAVFTIRTSGTEPKIKYYSELRGDSEEQARKDLSSVVQAIGDELVEYQQYNLLWRR